MSSIETLKTLIFLFLLCLTAARLEPRLQIILHLVQGFLRLASYARTSYVLFILLESYILCRRLSSLLSCTACQCCKNEILKPSENKNHAVPEVHTAKTLTLWIAPFSLQWGLFGRARGASRRAGVFLFLCVQLRLETELAPRIYGIFRHAFHLFIRGHSPILDSAGRWTSCADGGTLSSSRWRSSRGTP